MLGHCPNEKPATEIFPHDWFGYVETEDVDALRAEFVGRGAQCSEPKEQPYGMREIVVTTVDGHRIAPSSAPCLTVKFCFIARLYYRE